jgi:HJR/Mrr/RecB family endonuclease
MPLNAFKVGELYSNEAIGASLGVGNAGGIRPNLNRDGSIRRLVLLTALPTAKVAAENPYHDRVEGNVLIYTGKGLRGDQEPGGLNKRLVGQVENQFPVWCFQQAFSRRDKTVGKDRWKFLGLLSLIRFHRENQLDVDGALRSVWLFEFDIATKPATVGIENDAELAKEVFLHSLISRIPDPSDRVLAEEAIDPATEVGLERLRGWLLAQHPRDFEFIVKKAFDASGYQDVAVTRYSQDGGIDVVASFGPWGWPVHSRQVQVQAKRWLHTVGRKEVAELRGSMNPYGLGCLITTSHFSKAAVSEASEVGKTPITLINGRDFAALLTSLGIGPSTAA